MTKKQAFKFLRLPDGSSHDEIASAIHRVETNLSKRLGGELTPEDRSRYERIAGQLKEARAALIGDSSFQQIQTDKDDQPDSLRVSQVGDLPMSSPRETMLGAGQDAPSSNAGQNPVRIPTGSDLSQTQARDLPMAGPLYTNEGKSWGEELAAPGAVLMLSPGQVLANRYEIKQRIGAGGMGAVFAAHDRVRDEDIAIKVLLPKLLENAQAKERFLNEAKIASSLSHPNIVNVFDIQQDGNFTFITMELLKGGNLRDEIVRRQEREQRFTIDEVRNIAEQLCDALSHAHKQTVHRDVKPENIWLCEDGTIKLMDFGIARLMRPSQFTSTGLSMGTAYYMAPEQLKGSKDVDHRADQYSVGVLLYELLTGEIPQGRFEDPHAVRKSIPLGLSNAILTALEGSAGKRHADITALKKALAGKARRKSGKPFPKKAAIAALALILAIGGATYPKWKASVIELWNFPSAAELAAEKDSYFAERGPLENLQKKAFALQRDIPAAAESASKNRLQLEDRLTGERDEAKRRLYQERFDEAERDLEIAEKLAALWEQHPEREAWYNEAQSALSRAQSQERDNRYAEALGSLKDAGESLRHPLEWHERVIQSLKDAQRVQQLLSQSINSCTHSEERALFGWATRQIESANRNIELAQWDQAELLLLQVDEALPEINAAIKLRREMTQERSNASPFDSIPELRSILGSDYQTASKAAKRGDQLMADGDPRGAKEHYSVALDAFGATHQAIIEWKSNRESELRIVKQRLEQSLRELLNSDTDLEERGLIEWATRQIESANHNLELAQWDQAESLLFKVDQKIPAIKVVITARREMFQEYSEALEFESISELSSRYQSARRTLQRGDQLAVDGDFRGAQESYAAAQKSYRELKTRALGVAGWWIEEARQTAAGMAGDGMTTITRWYTFQTVAEAQAETGDFIGAQRTADWIENSEIKVYVYSAIAETQAEAGDVLGAQNTLAEGERIAAGIEQSTLKQSAQTAIATAQVALGDVAGAKETVAGFDWDLRRARMLSIIAAAQTKAGDNAGARNTFTFAKQTAAGIEFLPQRSLAYLSIALNEADAEYVADAHSTLKLAKKWVEDNSKDVYFDDIAKAQAKVGDVTGAMRTAAEIEDAYRRGGTFVAIAKAQAKVGDVAGAMRTAGEIEHAGKRAGAFAAIAEAQAKVGDVAGAMRTVEEIEDAGERAWAFATIAKAQAGKGNMDGARKTIALANGAAAEDAYISDDTYVEIAAAQAAAGRISIAMRTAEELESEGSKSDAYRKIATALAAAGDFAGARNAFALAKKAAAGIDGVLSEHLIATSHREIAEAQAQIAVMIAEGQR